MDPTIDLSTVIERLALMTVFDHTGIHRYVTSANDARNSMGLFYGNSIAIATNVITGKDTIVCIKPFKDASADEIASIE